MYLNDLIFILRINTRTLHQLFIYLEGIMNGFYLFINNLQFTEVKIIIYRGKIISYTRTCTPSNVSTRNY